MPQTTAHSTPAGRSLHWEGAIAAAVRDDDEQTLWALVANHPDAVAAYECLAMNAARHSYVVGRTASYLELFAFPVIGHSGHDAAAGDWEAAEQCVTQALADWLGPGVTKTVFRGLRPYAWLSAWTLPFLRSHLRQLVPGTESIRLNFDPQEPFAVDLPSLAFVCFVVRSRHNWPGLPTADTLQDIRFKQVVGEALRIRPHQGVTTTLAPDRLRHAMTDGLCLWLRHLDQTAGLEAWRLSSMPDADALTLTLLPHGGRPSCELTLRRHQIGLEGVNTVMATLHELAPMLNERSM